MSERVYLSIGTNMGDRLAHLKQAVDELANNDQIEIDSISPVYETEPVGDVVQNAFYNIAVALTTTLSAEQLLDFIHQVEQHQHRTRKIHWGPRTIDLDILYYGDYRSDTDNLKLPHPEIANRRFVLVPLLDVTKGDSKINQKTRLQLKKTTDHNWVKPIKQGGVISWTSNE